MKILQRSLACAAALVCSFTAIGAVAQTYPAKPVRIVVAFPAGGAVDTGTRAIGQKLSDIWKQPVVVENRAGAGGNIGADVVAKAAPDGYTLLSISNALAMSPSLYRKLPYDASRDFVPLIQLTSSYLVLAAHPKLQVSSVKALLELARAKPGSITYASTGVGAAPHLVMERLKGLAKVDLLHVPYKGDAQVAPAILSGEVQVAFMTPPSVVSHVRSGKLRALGVTKLTPAAVFEGVPVIADSLPGFEYSGYIGLYAPAGTPREVVAVIQRDAARVLAMPDLQQRLAAAGFEAPNTTPEQFPARYHRDIATFAQIVRDARIQPQE